MHWKFKMTKFIKLLILLLGIRLCHMNKLTIRLHTKIPRLVHCKNRFGGITESIFKASKGAKMTALMGPSVGIFTILVYYLNWLPDLRHQTTQLFYETSESLQKESPCPDNIGAQFDRFLALKNWKWEKCIEKTQIYFCSVHSVHKSVSKWPKVKNK